MNMNFYSTLTWSIYSPVCSFFLIDLMYVEEAAKISTNTNSTKEKADVVATKVDQLTLAGNESSPSNKRAEIMAKSTFIFFKF